MSDEATRPTEPEPRKIYVTWHNAKPVEMTPESADSANYARHTFSLPITFEHAQALERGLQEYKRRCAAVIDALEVKGDDGRAYRDASAAKHAQFNFMIGLMEGVLAHIGVHAK